MPITCYTYVKAFLEAHKLLFVKYEKYFEAVRF